MTTQRRTPQGYTGFVETTAYTEMYAAPKPKDYKDLTRTNPELEATRERWETLYCNSLVPPPATPFNPVWPALWVIVIVGLCFIAAAG
jgi:hypothetical protein